MKHRLLGRARTALSVKTEAKTEWLPIESAPTDGTLIRLYGIYPCHRDNERHVAVTGLYETGGWTEGWVDERYNEFWPDGWLPITPPAEAPEAEPQA